jgi:PAT family beta-lactamase induction signal transducer AmpG
VRDHAGRDPAAQAPARSARAQARGARPGGKLTAAIGTRLAKGLDAYLDRRVLIVLAMGFSSGLPLALSGATLSFWLAKVGVSKTDIGLFALVGLAYNLKFVWSPLFDNVAAPWLGRRLGRRRAWGIVTQLGLIAALLATGASDPAATPLRTALCAVAVAFFSASQDIVIDAYRVEILAAQQQGAGAAVTQYGYRIGMLASGAGALFLSTVLSWFAVYAVMAGLVGLGVMLFLVIPEPVRGAVEALAPRAGPAARLREAIVEPFVDFARHGGWAVILAFVVLFKLGDALAGNMATPFYVEMRFTAAEIATITKIFGLLATTLGIFCGGLLVAQMPLMRALLIAGVLQLVSIWMFAAQAMLGHNVGFLTLTIFTENLMAGIGSAAFVAYLSSLCTLKYTATHYALLSSLAAFGRTLLSSPAGWIADRLDWVAFFLVASAAALPGLALLVYLMRTAKPAQPMAGALPAAE